MYVYLDIRSLTVASIQRFQHAMSELRSETRAAAGMKAHARKVENKRPGRVIVSIDVHELGPIELEVRLF